MRVRRPDFEACGWTKLCRLKYLPVELAVLVTEVEALHARLPTIGMRELSGELLEILDALRAFRDLEFHTSDEARKLLGWEPRAGEASSDDVPPLRGRHACWRAAA